MVPFTGQHHAVPLGVVAQAEAVHGVIGQAALGKIGGFAAVGEAGFQIRGRNRFFARNAGGGAPLLPAPPRLRSGPLRGTVRGPVTEMAAGGDQGFQGSGEVFVHGQQVEQVVIRPAGKAVDLVSLRVEAHGGVPVQVRRVQAAEPLPGVDAPFVKVVYDSGSEGIKGIGHSKSP